MQKDNPPSTAKITGGDRPEPDLPRNLRKAVFLTRLVLSVDAFWAASWPFCVSFSAVALWMLLGLVGNFPVWLHLVFLISSGLLLLGTAVWFCLKVRLPSRHAIYRRLEVNNSLAHRPLSSLGDRPVQVTANGLRLWQENKFRLARDLKSLRIPQTTPLMISKDPYGLRSLLALGLFIALFSIDLWPERLNKSLNISSLLTTSSGVGTRYSIWLTPPDYTGAAPLFFDQDFHIPPRLDLPENSRAIIQVHGPENPPDLRLASKDLAFEQTGETSFQSSFQLTESGTFSVRSGFQSLIETEFDLKEDLPPSVILLEKPLGNTQGLLRLVFETRDDYGTTELGITFWQNDPDAAEKYTLPLPASNEQQYQSLHFLDLTDHIWAGEEVWLQLSTKDRIGQIGLGDQVKIRLPERTFTHPLARTLVSLRKDLVQRRNNVKVMLSLDALVKQPQNYDYDSLVSLALSVAGKNLLHRPSEDSVAESQNLLWRTALHLENGRLSTAQRDLRQIQEQLREALAADAGMEEIAQLMDQLQQAVDSLLTNMLEEFLKNEKNQPPSPIPDDQMTVDQKDLQEMIDQARMLAENGQLDEAQKLLSDLQNMLENMAFQQGQQQQNPMSEAGRRAFEELQDLIKRQEELLENSYKRQQELDESRQGGQKKEPGEQPSSRNIPGNSRPGDKGQGEGENEGERQARDAKSQEQLRQELEQLMQQLQDMLGQIPDDLEQAEQSMGIARDALQGQDGDGTETEQAVQAQTRSLRKLQNGAEQAAEKFLQMLSQAPESGSGWVRGQSGKGRDPFGRNLGENGRTMTKQGVPLPKEADFLESRGILQELRERRNDRNRSQEEKTYIQRLLERF
ncbi:DUF4175 domain-containing protein [Kiloniella laminariae]|uniref:DUF4175 domain-containing protein n=1 Tax=Kiloniella laminariae TaxID=454162 RepID=UPI00037EB83A|nr:DUF4175 family protein [Kiloniella laminariae]